jgi:hypothetical protein
MTSSASTSLENIMAARAATNGKLTIMKSAAKEGDKLQASKKKK